MDSVETFYFGCVWQIAVAALSIASVPERFLYTIAQGIPFLLAQETFWLFIIQHAGFIVFTVNLIRIPSMCLAILFREVSLKKSASIAEMVELEKKWKRHYFLICDIVADVNGFIGGPLLLFIAYAFITSVSYSFAIVYALINPEDIPFVFYSEIIYNVAQNIICIILLVFVSEKIPKQVSYDNRMIISVINLFREFYTVWTGFRHCLSTETIECFKRRNSN